MRHFQLPGKGASTPTSGLSQGERKRLVLLLLATLFVTAALGALYFKSQAPVKNPAVPDQDGEADVEQSVAVPPIDRAKLDSLVEDARPADRVVLESDGLDAALDVARVLTPRHFRAMDERELDADGVEELLADPAPHRGDAYLARGWIESLRKRNRGPANATENIGQLLLDDGTPVYFVALDLPDESIVGDYVRVDGLFLKDFSQESSDEAGKWIEGPLLVAPRAIRSYPALGEVTEMDPKYVQLVQDDQLASPDGTPPHWEGLPFEGLWALMAYARDLPEGSVDWESAPVLDAAKLHELTHEGAPYRFQPFRIPISRLQGIRVRRAGENPARIERYTEGWIGNTTWRNVIEFQSPVVMNGFDMTDFVYGRGFFLKDFAYEPEGGGVHIAPAFVLVSLEHHRPGGSSLLRAIAYLMVGMVVFTSALFFFLLRRDRRRSERLEQDLARRRRAREERRRAGVGPASP